MGNRKRRGVRGSRIKLESALRDSNLSKKTQSGLADEIAEKEDLEIAPKDLVSKLFRELPVAPQTIERVARVLGVKAETLYLADDDLELNNDYQQTRMPEVVTTRLYKKIFSFLFLSVILITIFFLIKHSILTDSKEIFTTKDVSPSDLGQQSLVFYSYSETTDGLTKKLFSSSKKYLHVIILNRELLPEKTMTVDIAREYQADGVLTIRNKIIGRYIGIQVFLYFNKVEKLIWADSFSTIEYKQLLNENSDRILSYVKLSLGYTVSDPIIKKGFSDISSQQKYLKATNLLDDYQSELKLKQAQTLLLSAIEQYPNFSKAYAALCESYIYESWKGNEKELLEDASNACHSALKISPDDPYIVSTMAYLYRRTGRLEDAFTLYQNILNKRPDNINAISGISSVYLEFFRQNSKKHPDAASKMIQFAEKSVQIDPDYWQYHSSLGLLYYFTGNISEAIHSFEISAKQHPNESAYANIGSLYKCRGNIDKAEHYYKLVQNLAPTSYIGDDYLGTVYFYKSDFKQSAFLKQRALDRLSLTGDSGLHQMWGELGDAYRLNNQLSKARDAYLKAIKIVERDTLRGNIATADKVYRYYYYLILTEIDPTHYKKTQPDLNISILKKLLKEGMDSGAYASLAHSFYIQQKPLLAKKALNYALQKCPLYVQSPDLKMIASFNQS